MAVPGTGQTYDLAVGLRLDIENMIHMITPSNAPLQGMYDINNLSVLSTDTTSSVKVEWLEETLLLPKTTLSAAITNTTATSVAVATGDGLKFQTGDVIQVGTEQMQIIAISGDTFTVTRPWGGSTAATASNAAVLFGVGSALAEGSDPPAARVKDRVDVYNNTQIYGPVAITLSATENVIAKYGLQTTEFNHQIANRLREQVVTRELSLINGRRYAGAGSVGRSAGGIDYYTQTNTDSTTTVFSESVLLTQLQAVYVAGGNPDRLMVGPKQKQVFSGVGSTNIRYTQGQNARGQTVGTYTSDFGDIMVIMNRHCQVNQAYVFAREQATIVTMRPFGFEMLAKTGDSIKGQIVGESTLRFRMETHAAKFTALT